MSGSGKLPEDITDDLPIGIQYQLLSKKAEEEWEAEKARKLAERLDAEEKAATEKGKKTVSVTLSAK